jgi:plastocyanin
MSRIGISIWMVGIAAAMLCTGLAESLAQIATQPSTTTLRGHVEVIGMSLRSGKRHEVIPETVVWLTPIVSSGDESRREMPTAPPGEPAETPLPQLVQKNKTFLPHILVVPAGSPVEFPNRDPFFHNVFSLFEGKRFDLGLYEAGTTRSVRFERPGISYIFCNIHPEMNAVIITMATRLFAISKSDGQVTLPSVPFGRYKLHIWSEGMGPESAQPLVRDITITESAASLGAIRVPPVNGQSMAHSNKYGREYDEPTPNNPVYEQQR